MVLARYRFFPHVRRGLATTITDPATALSRAKTKLRVSVTAEIAAARETFLIGPGDVLGIDRRLIVRTEPRADARAVEPNYLAAIEFDLPDFPWMFTPLLPDANRRLQPWLVLVVLDLEKVGQPQVKANRPLPFVTLPGTLPQTELPDLSDSWAWAHAQRIDSGEADDAAALAAAPERNVSRLICPRRLSPARRWLACLVPAFDLGRQAGLGEPVGEAAPGPAWTSTSENLELPLYHHWVFETGPDGDFEKLASRLKPYKAVSAPGAVPAGTARRARAWLGGADASAALAAALPPGDTNSAMRMDAPLETLDRDDAVPGEVQEVLAAAIAAAVTPGDPDAPDAELLPPVYGGRHARREAVEPARLGADWLDELNLDPRTRAAARTGGDVVRGHQEDLMQTAWEQIGDVLAANAQLDRSRFMAAVAARGFERHLAKLAPTRLLAVTAALHARTRVAGETPALTVARTSLADRTFDAALRRMSSDTARAARSADRFARRHATERASLAATLGPALQKDAGIVDPSTRERDGIGSLGVIAAAAGRLGADTVLTVHGTAIGTVRALTDAVPALDDRLEPRADLAENLFTDTHRREAAVLAAQTGESPERILQLARRAAADTGGDAPLVLRQEGGTLRVQPLVRGRTGIVSIVEDGAKRALFRLDQEDGDQEVDASTLMTLVANMPAGVAAGEDLSVLVRVRDGVPELSFARLAVQTGGGLTRAKARANALREVAEHRSWKRLGEARGGAGRGLPGFVGTVAAPIRDARVAGAMRGALNDLAASRPDVNEPALVRADLGAAEGGLAAAVKAAVRPARTFRDRAGALVAAPDWLSPRADLLLPIRAVPDYQVAVAAMLAQTAPQAFLPRDVVIPPDSITALRTNPRWVAACTIGANHELNRELAWRTYPTDGRGTPLGRFWDWFDPGREDVAAIHAWPRAGPLSARLVGGGTANIVLAARGALLQRYPNTLLFAWKAAGPEALAPVPDDAAGRRAVLREAQFRGFVPPDLTLVGFDLTPAEFLQGWFLVLQEPLSESRFGLDEEGTQGGRPRNVNGLGWTGRGVAQGAHLPAASLDASPAFSSAKAANMLLQRPVRVAIHSDRLASALD